MATTSPEALPAALTERLGNRRSTTLHLDLADLNQHLLSPTQDKALMDGMRDGLLWIQIAEMVGPECVDVQAGRNGRWTGTVHM